MSGSIPPLPNTPSWRGAQLRKSTGTTLPFTFMEHELTTGPQTESDASSPHLPTHLCVSHSSIISQTYFLYNGSPSSEVRMTAMLVLLMTAN
jgi:hypothetical protein